MKYVYVVFFPLILCSIFLLISELYVFVAMLNEIDNGWRGLRGW